MSHILLKCKKAGPVLNTFVYKQGLNFPETIKCNSSRLIKSMTFLLETLRGVLFKYTCHRFSTKENSASVAYKLDEM